MMLFSSSRATRETAFLPRVFVDDCTSPTTDTDHTPLAMAVGGRYCTAPIDPTGMDLVPFP